MDYPAAYDKLKRHADSLRTANVRLQNYHRQLEEQIEIYENALGRIVHDQTNAKTLAGHALKGGKAGIGPHLSPPEKAKGEWSGLPADVVE